MTGGSSRDGTPTDESVVIEETETAPSGAVGRWFAAYFGFEERGTDLQTEIVAGVTTFLTMSYIIVVNPALLAGVPGGKPGIVMAGHPPAEVRQMLAVTTILAAAVAIFVMAFYANRPFAQAPGLGLNAFFAFTVVGTLGISWQTGLAAVVTEGVLFMVLTAVGARKHVVELFLIPVKFSVGTGIGLFLAIVGLQEMRVVVADPESLVTLGSIASDPVALLSVFGLFLTLALYAKRVTGAIILGILTTTLVGMGVTLAGVLEPGVVAAEFVRNGGFTPAEPSRSRWAASRTASTGF